MGGGVLLVEERDIVVEDVPAQVALAVTVALERVHQLLLLGQLPRALLEPREPRQPLTVQLVDLLLVVTHQLLLLAHLLQIINNIATAYNGATAGHEQRGRS